MTNRTYILLFGFFMFSSCKSDYEKGIEMFNMGEFRKAELYLIPINVKDEDYEKAQLTLKKIAEIRDSIQFYEAIKIFNENSFRDANYLFTGISKKSKYYDSSQVYIFQLSKLILEDPVDEILNRYTELKEDKSMTSLDSLIYPKIQKVSEELLTSNIRKIEKLYNDLMVFKDENEFHAFGFAVTQKYNYWMEEINLISKDNNLVNNLYDAGYPVIDLRQIGLEYMGSKGRETDFTRHFRKKYPKMKR